MKLLFLDVDGVMNPDYHPTSKTFALDCVQNLQAIIQSVQPLRVVISSSWKEGFSLFKLGHIWCHHGFPLEMAVGKTPDIRDGTKADEIAQWLDRAGMFIPGEKISQYAVLDDDQDQVGAPLDQKSVFLCDHAYGLTEAVANSVIAHLEAK